MAVEKVQIVVWIRSFVDGDPMLPGYYSICCQAALLAKKWVAIGHSGPVPNSTDFSLKDGCPRDFPSLPDVGLRGGSQYCILLLYVVTVCFRGSFQRLAHNSY